MAKQPKYFVNAFDRPNGRGSGGLKGSAHVDSLKQAIAWVERQITSDDWMSDVIAIQLGERFNDGIPTKTYVRQSPGKWILESDDSSPPRKPSKLAEMTGSLNKLAKCRTLQSQALQIMYDNVKPVHVETFGSRGGDGYVTMSLYNIEYVHAGIVIEATKHETWWHTQIDVHILDDLDHFMRVECPQYGLGYTNPSEHNAFLRRVAVERLVATRNRYLNPAVVG